MNNRMDITISNYGILYDKGLRDNNQDSISFQSVHTRKGEASIAVVCDGVGGLKCGEIASGYLCERISTWFYKDCMLLYGKGAGYKYICQSLFKELFYCHNSLKEYGNCNGINLGSTISVLLSLNNKGIIVNVGDSEVIKAGTKTNILTPIERNSDNHLTRCIGVGSFYKPFNRVFKIRPGDSFIVCTDGFYHYIDMEMIKHLNDSAFSNASRFLSTIQKRNINKGETDNASAIYVRY